MPHSDERSETTMRFVTFRVTHDNGFHSISREIAEETAFGRETVHQFNFMEDGTAVVLCQVYGDVERAREMIAGHPEVLSATLVSGDDGGGLSYIHLRPSESITELLQLPRRHEVVFEFPLEGVRADELRVTMIGETDGVLQEALADVPDAVDVTVERLGSYPADGGEVTARLTDRQREVLDAATDLGYYEVPRQATHADIAERVDLDPGTVSEHMQKIEARVFEALAG